MFQFVFLYWLRTTTIIMYLFTLVKILQIFYAMTGDKKWVTYYNIKRKRLWLKTGEVAQTLAKTGMTDSNVLICVWWDCMVIVHYELLTKG